MNNDIKIKLINYVNQLIEDSEAFRNFLYDSCENRWWIFETWCEENKIYDFSLHAGATKGVIELVEFPYVLKLPFLTGMGSEDYCKLEWRNYLLAKDKNLDDCFAETGFLENFNFSYEDNQFVFPIYYQQKVDCDEDSIDVDFFEAAFQDFLNDEWREREFEDEEEAKDYFYDVYYDMDNEERYSSCLRSIYGKKYEDFVDFCYVNNINDLHTGNFGFIYKNNGLRAYTIVATDFSGYGQSKIFSTCGWDSICKAA